MKRITAPSRLAFAALVLLGLAAASGCSKKVTSADPGYTKLEGQTSGTSRLYAWPVSTVEITTYIDDHKPVGPPTIASDSVDDVVDVKNVYAVDPAGTIETMLIDGSKATGFQIYRTSTNGGLELMRDFVLTPVRRWLDSQYEVYQINDPKPSSGTGAYVARGILAGQATSESPLTNVAIAQRTPAPQTLVYTGESTPRDSLFQMSWGAVPGATGYWIHVYQFRSEATNEEKVASGSPSVIWPGKVRDFFVGFVPAPATSFKLGARTGALVLTQKAPLFGQEYLVRITAVNDDGEIVAYMKGSNQYLIDSDKFYRGFGLAAFKVLPTKPTR